MTQPARICQQDIDRTMKAIGRAGIERARVILDFENRRIEVMIGESAALADGDDGEWTDDD